MQVIRRPCDNVRPLPRRRPSGDGTINGLRSNETLKVHWPFGADRITAWMRPFGERKPRRETDFGLATRCPHAASFPHPGRPRKFTYESREVVDGRATPGHEDGVRTCHLSASTPPA